MDKIGYGLLIGGFVMMMLTAINKDPQKKVFAWETSEQCTNVECSCKDCKCDPCECKEATTDVSPEKPLQGDYILFFTRDYCPPCELMKPLASELYREGHEIYTVHENDRPDLFTKYGVTMTPQFLVVNHGTVKRRVIGATVKEAVLGLEGTMPTLHSQPVMQSNRRVLYTPQRSGWFRGRSTRVFRGSACGPGGCR